MTDLDTQIRTYFDALLEQDLAATEGGTSARDRRGVRGRGALAAAAALASLAAGFVYVTATRDGGIRVDVAATSVPAAPTTTPPATYMPADWLPDAGVVVVRPDGAIELVNAEEPDEVKLLAPSGTVAGLPIFAELGIELRSGVALSPGGNTVVYERLDESAHPEIVVAPADGAGPVETIAGSSPALSSDGRLLAYVTMRQDSSGGIASALVVRDLGDGTETSWTASPLHHDESSGGMTGGAVWDPSWAPDSRHVLTGFYDDETGERRTVVVDAQSPGGRLRDLAYFTWVQTSQRCFFGDPATLLVRREGSPPPGSPGGSYEYVVARTDGAGTGETLFTTPYESYDDPLDSLVAVSSDTSSVMLGVQRFPETEGGPWPPGDVLMWSRDTGLTTLVTGVYAMSWWEREDLYTESLREGPPDP